MGLAVASGAAPLARPGVAFLSAFGLAAFAVGSARAVTTTYLPVLLDRIESAPGLIGVVMLINPLAGFAVPVAVGIWSDRVRTAWPRLPFLVGGTLLAAGGLGAVASGTGTSYLMLALAGFAVYAGLNAVTTAHRTIVAERFPDRDRPAATSAQEIETLVGGLLGLVVGGALIATAPAALFLGAGFAVPLLAGVTVLSVLRYIRSGAGRSARATAPAGAASPRALVAALRRPGTRELLIAQLLWVMAYVALPAFFILYAENVFGLGPAVSSILLAAFGVVTGAGMVAAGRTAPEHVYPLLLLGAALLGGGLLAAAAFDELALVAPPLAAAALGFGLVTALGFPYFARFIPEGQAGRYSGLYFSMRAVAAAAALPLAGLLVAATGSYRLLLVQGGAALLALVPLALARPRRGEVAERADASALGTIGAVIPCRDATASFESVVRATLRHVDEAVLVDDGAPSELRRRIDALAGERVAVRRLGRASGKGHAVAAGAHALLARPDPPDAIVVVDADGQHPPEAIPQLAAAAAAGTDVAIGNRMGDLRSMPWARRFSNLSSSALLSLVTRRLVPDSQCGMRLYRAGALRRLPFPGGRYEAETRHLKAALAAGLRVAWVPIPAIYDGEPSSFRPLADSALVLREIFVRRGRERRSLRLPAPRLLARWSVLLAALVTATGLGGPLLVDLLGPLDERLFVAVNSLGDGPEVLYQALDPHTRNYILLGLVGLLAALALRRRPAVVAAAAFFAAHFSNWLLQLTYELYDRPRPEEVLPADQVLLTHERTWAHIEALPSGHMVVTAAIAAVVIAAVPRLRGPVWLYIAAVGLTRVLFGSHFPLDVVVGVAFGWVAGRFPVTLLQAAGLFPEAPEETAHPRTPPLRPAAAPAGAGRDRSGRTVRF